MLGYGEEALSRARAAACPSGYSGSTAVRSVERCISALLAYSTGGIARSALRTSSGSVLLGVPDEFFLRRWEAHRDQVLHDLLVAHH